MVLALLAAVPTASMGLFYCMFGNGNWFSHKTKAEYEAERLTRFKKVVQNCVLLSLAVKFWLGVFHGLESWTILTTGPTLILALSIVMQLQYLRSPKVVLKNKETILQKLTSTVSMLLFQLVPDAMLSMRREAEYSLDRWLSSSILLASLVSHVILHRILQSIIKSSSATGGTICAPCRKDPPLAQKFKDHTVILAGCCGYLYIWYCYATSSTSAPGFKHTLVIVACAVLFECSAARMVHICLKHAGLVKAQGKHVDMVMALLVFCSSHVTLFRGYFYTSPIDISETGIFSGVFTDLIRYGPQIVLWKQAFNLSPPKASTSWFSPCVICGGARKE